MLLRFVAWVRLPGVDDTHRRMNKHKDRLVRTQRFVLIFLFPDLSALSPITIAFIPGPCRLALLAAGARDGEGGTC